MAGDGTTTSSKAAGLDPAAARKTLEGMVSALRAQYPRRVHEDRLDQIEGHATSLAHLIEQLADEGVRTEHHLGELLGAHDAGEYDRGRVSQDSHNLLMAELADRKGTR